jgi:3-oxoadipate CoA-transferase alpha subunit
VEGVLGGVCHGPGFSLIHYTNICSIYEQIGGNFFDTFLGRQTFHDQQDSGLGGPGTWSGVPDGATVLIGGFGTAGIPDELIDGLIAQGARDLTMVNNNAGNGDAGRGGAAQGRTVRKIICSFPRQADSHVFDALYRSGKLELELVPQGNLAERIRAAGAGIGAFLLPHGYGTEAGPTGKGNARDQRQALRAGVPHLRRRGPDQGRAGDRWGNLTYRMSARNFGPRWPPPPRPRWPRCTRWWSWARWTPKPSSRPGVYVSHVVKIERVATQAGGIKKSA